MTEATPTQDVVSPAPTNSGAAPVAPAPVADTTPTPAAPITESAPAPAADTAKPSDVLTSVIGDATTETKPTEGKPDVVETKPEAKKEGEVATKEVATPETKAPVFEEFKFPENYGGDKEALGEFTKILGEMEIGKLDHKTVQEKGQALVDLGIKAVNSSIERLNDYYVQIHEKQKSDWNDAFKKDPEIGGDHIKTTVSNLGEAIESYGGSAEQIKELRAQMNSSGYGNYPNLIRLINNMQAKINSYTKETTSPVVPGQRPAPSKVKPYQNFYQKA